MFPREGVGVECKHSVMKRNTVWEKLYNHGPGLVWDKSGLGLLVLGSVFASC